MHPDVHWPNEWEGGHVYGTDQVKDYWTRQWKEINPAVTPENIIEKPDGRIEVLVRQVVKDLHGNIIYEGPVKHIYTIEQDKIIRMDIEKIAPQ